MEKDLTNSLIDRRNILNNQFALKELYEQVGFRGIMFEGKYRFTKQQIAAYFEVDIRTLERLLEAREDELKDSGYEIFKGQRLREFKLVIEKSAHGTDINVGTMVESIDNELINLSRSSIIGVFTFKSFLNVAMLLKSSDNAQILRSSILDIVIDVMNKRIGGNTKYINQREENFLASAVREHNYRKEFTDALDKYIDVNKFKYSQLTDKIYKSVFRENAKEYKQILNLNTKDRVRETLYSEVLDLIAAYENGFADFLKKRSEKLQRTLRLSEANLLFTAFEDVMGAFNEPLKQKARNSMASRDLAFRDALHINLAEYVKELSPEDFEKFIGQKSMSLEQRIEENKDVFIRLKDR